MAVIKNDEILGYVIDGEIVCRYSATLEEEMDATLDNVITEDDCEDEKVYFCNRCYKKHRLQ